MRRAREPMPAILAALLWLAPAPAAAASWSFDGELGAGYDGNAGNAASISEDKRDTQSVYAGAGANVQWPVGLYTALQLRGSVTGEAVSGLSQLSNGRAALRARLLHKPGEGFYVPVLALWGSAGVRDYGSAIRDGHDWRGGIYLAEPITTRIQTRVEVQLMRREASGRVFDLDNRSYALSLDWVPASWLTVYGEYRITDGDLAVTAQGSVTPKSQHDYLEDVADAIEPDDGFGEDWYAYRFDSTAHLATLGANFPLTAKAALDAQIQRGQASVGSVDYERWLGALTLLLRF